MVFNRQIVSRQIVSRQIVLQLVFALFATNCFAASLKDTLITGKMKIDGDADELTFEIEGNSTQTANIFEIEKSDDTDLLVVNNNGDITLIGDIAINGDDITSDGDLTITPAGGDVNIAGNLSISSLTKGSIVFSGSSGLLSEDNSNLFWDDTNDRLGIGTTSPTDPLHIDAGTQTDNTKEVALYIEKSGIGTITHWHQNKSSAQTYWWLTTVDTGTTLWSDGLVFGFDADSSIVLWNYENTSFRLATNGTERLKIFADGDMDIKSEGDTPLKVMSSGTEKFKIASDGDVSLYGDVDAQGSEITVTFSGTEKFKIASDGDVSLYGDIDVQGSGTTVTINGTEKFKIFEEGDVKITSSGTASNAARLQIRGPTGGTYGNMISVHSTASSATNNVYIKFTNDDTGENMWSDGFLFGIDTDESIAFWNYENTPFRIATNGTERFRILGNGDIGIRTTAPASSLDINGTNGYAQLRLRTTYTPTSTSDTNGNTGDIAWDSSYIYVKTSAGWKRSALSTF